MIACNLADLLHLFYQRKEKKQMYRTRFIYYCMTLFLLQLHRPDEQPDRHMHLTYPWPPVALVTAVLRGISVSVTANSQRIDSFTFVTASSLLRLIQPHFVAVACSVNYGKVTPSMTEQRHR
ncbi:hypothetical protein T05_6558 [Trichinella murrelli]|uniref:Uncharacterized protein n=1 Tax=Trichinella murrelli TaxID=144512 RepID=A0A0V0T5R0_9BILA|nr:hypothetical protein T05_6558 [Trichinella murrelli]